MTRLSPDARRRRMVRITLRADLIDEAKRLNVDISEACERGLVEQLSKTWLQENQSAIEDWNRYVEKNGLPFAHHRLF